MRLRTFCLWVGLGMLWADAGSMAGQEPPMPQGVLRHRLRAGDSAPVETDREERRLVGRVGGMTVYTTTKAERSFAVGFSSRKGDGGGADISSPRLIQERYLDSRCGFPEECGGPCNVVSMIWTETIENPQGIRILVDGEVVATIPGLPAAELPGSNAITIQGVEAGVRTFRAEEPASGAVFECALEVLDAQPFEDIADLKCEQGVVAGNGTCEVSVSWNNAGPFADEIGIVFDGRFIGSAGGNLFGLDVTEALPGEHCVDVFGIQSASECAIYRGCFLRTCCTVTCERPACTPPQDLALCQLTYGPNPGDNAVRAAWLNGETDYVGVTGLRDDVIIGTLPGNTRIATVGMLSLGLHRIGIQGDCGPPDGLSAIAEQDIVILDASPHPRPITDEGIACSFTPDPDGEGGETSTTTATWTNRDPSLFIEVYALLGTDLVFRNTIAGTNTEVTVRNTTPEHRVALEFFTNVNGDCYGSPLFACGPTAPPTNSYIQGMCNGVGTGPQITSAVFFLNFLFLGGAEPPA